MVEAMDTVLFAADLYHPPVLDRGWQASTNTLDAIYFLVPGLLLLTVVVLGIVTIITAYRRPAVPEESARRAERRDRDIAA